MRYQNDAVEQGSKGGEEKKSELALMQHTLSSHLSCLCQKHKLWFPKYDTGNRNTTYKVYVNLLNLHLL